MQKLDLQTLESKLWSCANILRGKLDSAVYKDYIIGLMFLKRICDEFEYEREQLKIKYANLPEGAVDKMLENPNLYGSFFVPKSARWNDYKNLNLNIGPILDKAFKAIEDEPKNYELIGVLTTTNYNDKDKVPDEKLVQLMQIFDGMNMSSEGLESLDVLGDAYMYLIKMFQDDSGKKGGEFFTPNQVKTLIVKLLKPQEGETIYDPTCGSGGFLIETINYLKENNCNHKNVQLYGQENNISTWAMAKLNILMHGVTGATIYKGDTIRNPQNVDGAILKTFDKVMANPPFSLKEWGIEVAENNTYNRFNYGVPPKSYGDLAFVEHMLASLNDKGIMASVVPHGVLFRGGTEGKIREGMLKDDLFEAVIGLPQNLFYGTGIPAAIIVLNHLKTDEHKGKVLFIDASNGFEKNGNKNELKDRNVDDIIVAYEAYIDQEKYASLVKLEEIKDNDYNLNISRYVDTSEEEKEIDINAVIARISARKIEIKVKENELNGYLRELGFESL
ncbi:type I restriction-modification system subunit M [[Clostridium] fimetarium]|uniref:site-specific DNA-methyltransferase (adenine-specific) n=1 Tax=[Clostridium] fimetarium TaxID=99656 RepID=A0A1I0MXW2_9FIRM|nr:type I restriction-modification system subunit M [[Clostridium] fimetarium]SEV93319.1 type I restriction enzyme M protein [[Clostridium] fimetarium]